MVRSAGPACRCAQTRRQPAAAYRSADLDPRHHRLLGVSGAVLRNLDGRRSRRDGPAIAFGGDSLETRDLGDVVVPLADGGISASTCPLITPPLRSSKAKSPRARRMSPAVCSGRIGRSPGAPNRVAVVRPPTPAAEIQPNRLRSETYFRHLWPRRCRRGGLKFQHHRPRRALPLPSRLSDGCFNAGEHKCGIAWLACWLLLLAGALFYRLDTAQAQGTGTERQACTPERNASVQRVHSRRGKGHRLHESQIARARRAMPCRHARRRRQSERPARSARAFASLSRQGGGADTAIRHESSLQLIAAVPARHPVR